MIEIFCWHDIDLEDENGLDFEDLLEKALAIVRHKKILADFIQDKETDLVSKYTDSQKKVPTTSNIVEPFKNPNPPSRFQTVQGAVQEDIPVVRIYLSQIEEFEANEVSSSNNASILVSDPTEDFYENMEAMFAEPVDKDEDLVQLRVGSPEPFEHIEGTRIGTQGLDIKSKNIMQRLELQAPKKDGKGTGKGRYPRPSCIVLERPRQNATKSEDHS